MNTVNEHEEYVIVERRKRDNRRVVTIFLSIFVGFPIFFVVLMLFLAVLFSPITKLVDIYHVSYERFSHNGAKVGEIEWNCELNNTEFTIPDSIGVHKIDTLGGFGGSTVGYFTVLPDFEHYSLGYRMDNDYYLENNFQIPDDDYEECKVVINLGKNIKKVDTVSLASWLVKAEIPENWREPEIYDIIYKIAYYFNVDPENKTFYSENGVVYWRETGEPVEELMIQ